MGIVVWWIGKQIAISVTGIIIQIVVGVSIYFALLMFINDPILKIAFDRLKGKLL